MGVVPRAWPIGSTLGEGCGPHHSPHNECDTWHELLTWEAIRDRADSARTYDDSNLVHPLKDWRDRSAIMCISNRMHEFPQEAFTSFVTDGGYTNVNAFDF